MANLNYAAQYAQALAQAFPYVLNFGALYATENNGRYRMGEDGKTIYIPRIKTTGRVDADRDTIAMATRNFDNSWEPKTLTHQRKWSTLVHPKDIDQTNHVASIVNITQTYNQEQKFPEMDAYLISTLYDLWTAKDSNDDEDVARTPDVTDLTTGNILEVFDKLMLNMDEARVPANGRILYVPATVNVMLKNAQNIQRQFDVQNNNQNINRIVSRLDEVQVIPVPSTLMKTAYTFASGWAVGAGAKQINMLLVHPTAVITPVSYEFAQLDPPSAVTEGKYIYFEESHEDVFILNKKKDALQFNITAAYKASTDTTVQSGKTYYTKSGDTYTAVKSPSGNPSTSNYYELEI